MAYTRYSRRDNKGRVLNRRESQCKDLKYRYQYTDSRGVRRSIYAKTLSDLREREKQLIRDQLDGIDSYCAGNSTLNYVFDRYIQSKTNLKPNTKVNYEYMYDRYVRDTFGKKIISKIRYSDVKSFYKHLIYDSGLRANTVDTIHTLLHPAFQMAVRDEIIRINPSDGVMGEIKKSMGKNKGVRHALTLDQQRAFLDYTKNSFTYCHWYPLMVVLFGTGCRISEVVGLRWEDVDYENRLISINHSVVFIGHRKYSDCYVSTPKTESGTRIIPMMDAVYDALHQEFEYQELGGFNTDEVDGMAGFIFRNRDGKLLKPTLVNRAIKRIYEEYNSEEIIKAHKEHREPLILPHFSCHHIRHTFCTRICENETNLKVIQSVMGHANIETTMDIYAEATDQKKKEALFELEQNNKIF